MGLTDEEKVAIVGAGNMAAEHARAFAAIPGVRIVGVHSRSRPRAAELAGLYGARVFDSVDALHAGTGADVVVVAVPELAARAVCTACFAHPWVCLLEKPVGHDLVDALAIARAAETAGARAFVAFNRRSHASTRATCAALAADPGARLIAVTDQQSMAEARAISAPDRVVQDWMYANSIHLVDYFTHLGRGTITSVAVTSPWRPDAPGLVIATLTYDSGDIGLYQAVWNGPGPWSVTVTTASTRSMRLVAAIYGLAEVQLPL